MPNEVFIIVSEDDYCKLSTEIRKSFKYVEIRESDEYQTHKSDPLYKQLYDRKKKASKEVQEYLFTKRHQ